MSNTLTTKPTQSAKSSLDDLKNAAAGCRTRTEFKEAFPGFYKRAWRKGVLDEICQHMVDQRVRWTKEKLIEEARKYSSRSDFAQGNPKAYYAARNRKWLPHICQHMKPKHDTIYLLRQLGTDIFKIGVTTEQLGLSRIEILRKRAKVPLELLVYLPFRENCRKLESRILLIGAGADIPGLVSNEIRRYTPADYQQVLNLLFEARTKN